MKNKLDYRIILKWIVLIFACCMVTIFPLYLSDGYFNARHDKLNLYYILTGALIIFSAAAYLFFDNRTKAEKLKNKFTFKSLSVTDWSIVAFGLAAVISTLCSQYKLESLTGGAGRNNGLILVIAYVVMYFIVSRCYKGEKLVPALLCATSAFVAILAVLNQFYWDPFNLYDGLSGGQVNKFLSTIGNRNILSAFLCLTFPVPFVSFLYSKKISNIIFTGFCAAANFTGVICCNSDSSILGVGIFLILLFLFIIKSPQLLARYFVLSGFMVIFCKLIRVLSYISDDYSMKFEKLQKFVVYGNTYVIFCGLIAIGALFFIISAKKPELTFPKVVQLIAVIIASVLGLCVIGMIIYYSCIDNKTEISGYKSYLRFNDAWGTHRGFMWIRAFYIFGDLGIVHKLFGTGADTFKLIMDATGYNDELLKYKNETTDCVHNVYLNYLITLGVAGVASYIATVGSSILRTIKKSSHNTYALIFIGAVLCYSIQAVVNIDQPITTPLLMLFIALAESQNRQKQNSD
jgi:hypothetical protein